MLKHGLQQQITVAVIDGGIEVSNTAVAKKRCGCNTGRSNIQPYVFRFYDYDK